MWRGAAFGLPIAVVLAGVGLVPVLAAVKKGIPKPPPVASVPGKNLIPPKPPADPTAGANMTAAGTVTWPAAKTVDVTLPASAGASGTTTAPPPYVSVPGTPVRLARSG